MSYEGQRLAGRMAAEGVKTVAFFESLPPEDWTQQVYTTGSEWRVREVLAHFVSAERAFAELLEDIVGGGTGAPRDLDIVEFNEREVPALAEETASALLDAFRAARRASADLAARMSDEDFNKHGYHPWFGDVDLGSMAKLVYRHNMIHLRDVRRALKTGQPVPHLEIQPPSARERGGSPEDG
jgi:uncharacterized protein (TIGR03083 family)